MVAGKIPDIELAPDGQDSGLGAQPRPESENNARQNGPTNSVTADKVVILSFRDLQLKRIAELQDQLLALSVQAVIGDSLAPDHTSKVDRALSDYAEALRNYETLSMNAIPSIPVGAYLVGSLARVGAEPPRSYRVLLASNLERLFQKVFGVSIRKLVQKIHSFSSVLDVFINSSPSSAAIVWGAVRLLMSTEAAFGPSLAIEEIEKVYGNFGFRELDQRGRLERARKQAFTQRLFMGVFGGIALIGPVLIMRLHASENTSLITVSVATILFAIALAFGASDSTGKDVLAATAAYTAVLVVFIGSSSSSG
ncbi:uncharacterized protein PAC_07699 [Phialocephala subalpina]|uniref:DUF6594 domain-containing protein n=1 Tax=Phialocephala subalpina TaxID=576137 RepID=A0A1L7WYH9_9HELO|nr:uncharacterized protein PAC_07699 [Phialocephala subalpina]